MKLLRVTGLAALALLFSTLATTSAFADQLRIDYATGNTHYGGGAFFVDNVVGGPLAGTTFNTFCLEEHEFFTPGNTYIYSISDRAVQGGVGPAGDPISLGTAYLYNKYLDDGANYNGSDQQALQEAIWFLEDEITSCTGSCASVLNAAKIALGTPGTPLTDQQIKANCTDSNQCYGVVALNLTDSNNNLVQDQLGRVPEAGATLLLSMGLAGLAWFARRKNLLPSGVRPLNV